MNTETNKEQNQALFTAQLEPINAELVNLEKEFRLKQQALHDKIKAIEQTYFATVLKDSNGIGFKYGDRLQFNKKEYVIIRISMQYLFQPLWNVRAETALMVDGSVKKAKGIEIRERNCAEFTIKGNIFTDNKQTNP